MVLVQFTLVIMRYVFGLGSILVQESLYYAHGTLFMIAAGYTLLTDGHVRVDVFYRAATPRRKAVVDLCGVLFLLLPVCILLWWTSFPYVIDSWKVLEGSRETSGIPGVFLLKSVILVFVVLIGLQGISLAIRSLQVLSGPSPAQPLADEIVGHGLGATLRQRQRVRPQLTLPILWVNVEQSKELEKRYTYQMLPSTYVIRSDGTIGGLLEGAVPPERLQREVARALRPRPTDSAD